MADSGGGDRELRPLGRFEVTAAAEHVEGLRAAIALPLEEGAGPEGAAMPATYPVIWLGTPEIRAAVRSVAPMQAGIPLHFSQGVTYLAPIVRGARYTLALGWRRLGDREDPRPKLEFVAEVTGPDGHPAVRMSSVILVVPPVRGVA